jgi:hypothetical protein
MTKEQFPLTNSMACPFSDAGVAANKSQELNFQKVLYIQPPNQQLFLNTIINSDFIVPFISVKISFVSCNAFRPIMDLMCITPISQCLLNLLYFRPNLNQINQSKRIFGDWGADLASGSSAALERERYAVQAIPTVDTKGCD